MNEDTRTTVRSLNDAALTRTLVEHPAITIRAQELSQWRPCDPKYVGVIEGLEHLGRLTPLCTDGTVAWFLAKGVIRCADEKDIVFANTKVGRPCEQDDEYGIQPETFLLHGHVKNFIWLGGEMSGAPPQPHTLPPPASRVSAITPFQSQKTGKWWYVRADGKWEGPHVTETDAAAAIASGSARKPFGRKSLMTLAMDLLKDL